MYSLKNGDLLLPFFDDLLLRKFGDCKFLLTPPPTPGEGAWGWGDNRVRGERLTPFGDRSLMRCVPPRTGVVIHI